MLCELGRVLMYKLMCYLSTHPRTPLIFQKSPSSENRKIIVHWSTNESENITIQNRLESFQGLGGSSYKLLRTSYGKGIQTFLEQPDHGRFMCYFFQSITLTLK